MPPKKSYNAWWKLYASQAWSEGKDPEEHTEQTTSKPIWTIEGRGFTIITEGGGQLNTK